MNKRRGWTLLVVYIALFYSGLVAMVFGSLLLEPGGTAERVLLGFFVFLLGLLLTAGGVGCYLAWFASQNSDMNRITGGKFRTVLWTVLLLIPIAGVLSMYLFTDHIQRSQLEVGVTGMHPVALFLLVLLLFTIGHIVAQVQMDKIGG